VAATVEGWRRYLANPDDTLAYIKSLNPNQDDDWMRYNFETLKTRMELVGDGKTRGVGVMTKARWDTLYSQLKEIGALRQDLDADQAWTDVFFRDVIQP
jgi:NitT/TauT family transport system substrate-binding protein